MRRNKPNEKRPPRAGLARPATASPGTAAESGGDRVAKIIARAGLCSRRDAEAWIAQGRVAVNGKTLTTPAVTIGPTDQISVDNKPLAQRQRTRLFLFHKPRGLVTTHKDPEGRATIFDYLREHAPEAPRLMSIGRLDINTEGLLLLTNDGGLARILELPTTGWLRRYRVRANGETTQPVLDGLAKGVTIDGVRYAGIEATLDRLQGANCWLTMGLREGKNREIKRVLEHLGLTVNRLIRISFGPFQLGELGDGKLEEVRTRVLRDQLGTALAQAAGVDFDAPLETPAEAPPEPERKPRPPPQPGARKPTGPRAKHARPEPEPEKLRHRPQPGPRKHVSALRAEDQQRESGGSRRRSEISETKDRKGRSITVERRVTANKTGKTAPTKTTAKTTGKTTGRTTGKTAAKTAPKSQQALKPRRPKPTRNATPALARSPRPAGGKRRRPK
jgi:23S rRNA pseudouridine2605 synthase